MEIANNFSFLVSVVPATVAPQATRPSSTAKGTLPSVSQAPITGFGSSEKLSLVTLSKFNILENTVEDIKNRVYGSMPKNEEILEEVRFCHVLHSNLITFRLVEVR